MFSFKTINKNKINCKGRCLCSSKAFSTLVKTSFANLITSAIPAASKPLIMESFCFLRWLYVSTTHLETFKKYVRSKFPNFDPPSALFCPCFLYMYPLPLLNVKGEIHDYFNMIILK